MQIHAVNFEALSQAAYGVIEGKPHWIAYQNRLLGPALVYWISQTGITYSQALQAFDLLMILLQNVILGVLLRKSTKSRAEALIWIIVFSFSFICIQHLWFYPWDSIDLIVFTLFAWGILQAKSMLFFILLFCVGIANRESALFIALYIMIDSFRLSARINDLYLKSRLKLITGAFLMLLGMAYTKIVRTFLFVSRQNGLDDKSHETIGNHIYLIDNLKNLFYVNFFSTAAINSAFILGSTAYLLFFFRQYTDAQLKATLVYCAIVTNILIFGIINETRMYIILLPFIAFMKISADIDPSIPSPRDHENRMHSPTRTFSGFTNSRSCCKTVRPR